MTTPQAQTAPEAPSPEAAPKSGWTSVDKDLPSFTVRSFVSGEGGPKPLRVRYYQRESDKALVGTAWFGPDAEGPPGHAHGGAVAAVLDEVMGMAAWLAGHQVVAAQMSINFRRAVPLEASTEFEGQVERVEGKKIYCRARLIEPNGGLFAESSGLYCVLDPSRLEVFRSIWLERSGQNPTPEAPRGTDPQPTPIKPTDP